MLLKLICAFFMIPTVWAVAAAAPVTLIDEQFGRGELIDFVESPRIPAGWSYYDWHSKSRTPRGGLCPGPALEVPAVGSGMGGWHMIPLHLPTPLRSLALSLRYRADADYTGNEPVVMIGWYDGSGRFLKSLFLPLPVPEKEKDLTFERVILPVEIPGGAEQFAVNLVSRVNAKDVSCAGSVRFERLRITMPPLPASTLMLRSDRNANWWKTGEPVTFSVKGTLPEDLVALVGTVFDSHGDKLTEVRVPASELMAQGWRWQPSSPGFYQIAFALAGKDGGSVPLVEEYSVKAALVNQIGVFSCDRTNVAVVPAGPESPVSDLFGFQMSFSPRTAAVSRDRDFRLARLVGGSFVRFHVQWFELEPERGRYDWKALDSYVDRCIAVGLKPVIGFYGTPRWASRRPDDVRYIVHVNAYSGYAAKDSADWENFIRAMVTRYRDRVHTWEVWNEPHLPTFSCYWHDTPENFVTMLKSAYVTIKEVQPDATVWLGGVGMRYLPFYHRIIELGAGRYFDTLALHGFGVNPAPFRAIDREYHSPQHPWVTSEWHACLMRYGDSVYQLNEQERGLRMMLDLFRQIGYGVKQVSFFELTNLSEKETLAFFASGKMPLNHNSGLFRRRPVLQPMLGAVIMHTFTGLFRGEIRLDGEYRCGDWKAVSFSGDAGRVLAFWHDGPGDMPVDPALFDAGGDDVITWEGKTVAWKPGLKLKPCTLYFGRHPRLPGALKNSEGILTMPRRKLGLRGPSASYGGTPLLDASGGFLPENAIWVTTDWHRRFWAVPSGEVSARYALALNGEWVDLAVEVNDPVHRQPTSGNSMWKGDGIQFAFDTVGEGYPEDRCEFQAALTPSGPFLYKEKSPDLVGDLPTNWSVPGGRVKHGSLNVSEPAPGRMLYLIRLHRSELYPMVPKQGECLRFSLLVNDNNGRERAGWLNWGDGIGDAKKPVLYGTLNPAAESSPVRPAARGQ